MSVPDEQYRWWLLDRDLELVSDGNVSGATLQDAPRSLNRTIDRLGEHGQRPSNQPYSLIVYRGAAVVACGPPRSESAEQRYSAPMNG